MLLALIKNLVRISDAVWIKEWWIGKLIAFLEVVASLCRIDELRYKMRNLKLGDSFYLGEPATITIIAKTEFSTFRKNIYSNYPLKLTDIHNIGFNSYTTKEEYDGLPVEDFDII